jgi:autotransporter family porin
MKTRISHSRTPSRMSARRMPLCIAITAAIATGFTQSAVANTKVWDGNGGANNWNALTSVAAGNTRIYQSNWSSRSNLINETLPKAGDSLIFAGTNRLSNTNDYTGLSLTDITFAAGAGAFTLGGNMLALTSGNVLNSSDNLQTLNLGISVTGNQNWNGGTKGLTTNGLFQLDNGFLTLKNKVTINDTSSLFAVGTTGPAFLQVFSGSVINTISSVLTWVAGSTSTVIIDGINSAWHNSGSLLVGSGTRGTAMLSIQNGGVVTDTEGTISGNVSSSHTVTVKGSGSQWNSSESLNIYYGTLNIQNAGTVTAGELNSGAGSVVNLDGGTLEVGSISNQTGFFNWLSGVLSITGSGDARLGSGGLDAITTLGSNKTLNVKNTLNINTGSTLMLDGGQFSAGTLALNGGSVVSSGAVDLSRTGTLVGHGVVTGKVTGGSSNTITASGGTLTLGNASSNGAYAFGGTLNVGAQQVVLLSADKAQLGVATNLNTGGNLSTVNGANLGKGNLLTFNGNSTIQGNFTNNGSVMGTAGTLTFVNDVNGAGGYAGNIAFKAAFNPGNSPAAVGFGGGNVSFDSASVLNMEIFGTTPGVQYDQLVSINTLTFNGTLNLVFGNGYVPLAGSSFALFGFNNFNGSFGTAADGYSKITVAGYDRSKLDFSHLATDGSVNVTAVPEPETYAMLLAGLGLMGFIVRRRRASGLNAATGA